MLTLGAPSPQFPILASGESSPSSPGNLRQLDDFFLQTQTRIWIGEVLKTRLDEEHSIADLLASGELLFELSKEIWNMMLTKDPEQIPYDYEPLASKKIGKYMPYSYVDSFLKMCKALGLSDIDLFCPSDVVEKGDTRKVCVCIQALSKKARSLDLDIPDFNIVTKTVAMPTDVVENIRRSLEPSHSEELRQSSSQEHLNEEFLRNYSSVKELGDSETDYTLQSESSTTNYSYNSYSELSSNSVKAKNECLDSSSETQEEDKSSQCQQEEAGSRKLKGSLDGLDNANQEENAEPSSVNDSNNQPGGSLLNVERGHRYVSNLIYKIYHKLNLEDTTLVSECSTPRGYITDDHRAVSSDSVSCFLKKTSDESQFLDGDAAEVSSVGSENSMSIHVQNLDFVDNSEIEQSSPDITYRKFDASMEVNEGPKSEGIVERRSLGQILTTFKKEESLKVKGASSGKRTTGYIDPIIPYDKRISKSHTSLNAGDEGKESLAAEPYLAIGFSRWHQKGKGGNGVVPTGYASWEAFSQSGSLLDSYQYIGDEIKSKLDSSQENLNVSCQKGNKNKDQDAIQKSSIEQTDDHTLGIGKSKQRKRPVLKAIVSGTAVVGAAALLLLFRKNGREKSGEFGRKSDGARSTDNRNLSSGKGKKACRADGVYPTEKLKL